MSSFSQNTCNTKSCALQHREEYVTSLKNTPLLLDEKYYLEINNLTCEIELQRQDYVPTPELQITVICAWDRTYCGEYNYNSADNYLYNLVTQTLAQLPPSSLPIDTTSDDIISLASNAESAEEWYHILSLVPTLLVIPLHLYEHSGVYLYAGDTQTDNWDTRTTFLAVSTLSRSDTPTCIDPDRITVAHNDIQHYCNYFNGDVYQLDLREPCVVTTTTTLTPAHGEPQTITQTIVRYDTIDTVSYLEPQDTPATLYDAYILLADYCDYNLTLDPLPINDSIDTHTNTTPQEVQ